MVSEISIPSEFKWWARMGYLSRGVVYLVVGGLAILTAFGYGGETTDSRGALRAILSQPFGSILLIAMIIGLVGYAIWRGIQSILDMDDHGNSTKGLVVRGSLMVSAFTHLSLAIWGVFLLLNRESNGSGGNSGGWLESQAGQIGLALFGLAAIAVGIAHMYKGATARFERYIDFPARHQGWARPVCQFGLIARGAVWCIVGWFFIDSARNASEDDLHGISDALAALQNSGYGPWLLGLVAAGLFAFGVYSCLEALYRRIQVPG